MELEIGEINDFEKYLEDIEEGRVKPNEEKNEEKEKENEENNGKDGSYMNAFFNQKEHSSIINKFTLELSQEPVNLLSTFIQIWDKHTLFRNFLRKIYPGRTQGQIENFTSKRYFNFSINGQSFDNYFKSQNKQQYTIDDVFTYILIDCELRLTDSVNAKYTNIVNKKYDKQCTYEWSRPWLRDRSEFRNEDYLKNSGLKPLDEYGLQLQKLIDNFLRADTEKIAKKYQEKLIDHIMDLTDNKKVYILNFLKNTQLGERETIVSLTSKTATDVAKLFDFKFKIDQMAALSSSEMGKINITEIIDCTVVGWRLRGQTRRNNEAALLNYYYNSTEMLHPTVREHLRKCQVFSIEEMNNVNDPFLLEHCVINSVKHFLTEEEMKKCEIHIRKLIKIHEYLPKKALRNLSNIIKRPIGLYEIIDGRIKYSLYNNGQVTESTRNNLENIKNLVHIGIIENHAIPVYSVPFSPLSIKALSKFPNLEKIDNIRKVEPTRINHINEEKLKFSSSFTMIINMFANGFMKAVEQKTASKIIKNKKLLFSMRLNEDLIDEIIPSDIYLGTNVLPNFTVNTEKIKSATRALEAGAILIKKCRPDLIDVKKDMFLNELKKAVYSPKGWDNVPERVVFADFETYQKTVVNGDKIVNFNEAYSIDYAMFTRKELIDIIENNGSLKMKSRIINIWGIQKYIKISDALEIKLEKKNLILKMKNGEEFDGQIQGDYFRVKNTSCAEIFCDHLAHIGDKKDPILVYFHNAKFDIAQFSQTTDLIRTNKNTCKKGGQIYSEGFRYMGKEIIIRDSYKMLSNPLSDFPKMFGFPSRKEYMPYQLYTEELVKNPIVSYETLKKSFNGKKINGKTFDDFISHIKELYPNAIENNHVNMKKYSQFYSKIDVEILVQGFLEFGKIMYKIKFTPSVLECEERVLQIAKHLIGEEIWNANIDLLTTNFKRVTKLIDKHSGLNEEYSHIVFNYLTIASFSHNFFIYRNCYVGTKTVTGSFREYIMKSVYGGHTMTGLNKVHLFSTKSRPDKASKQYIKDYKNRGENIHHFYAKYYKNHMSDYDETSHYPASMKKMEGFLKGYGKLFSEEQLFYMNKLENYEDLCDYIKNLSPSNKVEKIKKPIHFIFRIKVKNVPTKSVFPLLRENIKNIIDSQEDNLQWTNDKPNKSFVVEKYMLKAIMDTHNMNISDIEIVNGAYWPEGYNSTINDVISEIFNERKRLKKEKNPMELIYKLIMNSGYGKPLTTAPDSRMTYFTGTEDALYKHIADKNLIVNIEILQENVNILGENSYCLIHNDYGMNHFNQAHQGAAILGYSKIIISEPKIISDTIYRYFKGVPAKSIKEENIYKIIKEYLKTNPIKSLDHYTMKYMDTDSLMSTYELIYMTMSIYKILYGESLDGTELGQCHVDFKMSNSNLVNIFATDAIFLNKKEYAMILQGYNEETESYEYEEKFAFKGVPGKRIEETARQLFPESDFPIFDMFSSNKKYMVDIVGEDGFRVKYVNRGTVSHALTRQMKVVDFTQYENTYDRFSTENRK